MAGWGGFANGLVSANSGQTASVTGNSSSTEKINSTTQQDATSSQQTNALVQLLSSLFSETGSQSKENTAQQQSVQESQNVQALSPESLQELQGLIAQLTNSLDSELDVDAIQYSAVNQVLEAGLKDVLNIGTSARAYDDTATSLGAQKLGTKAAVAGQQAATDAILKDRATTNDLVNSIANLFSIEKGANTQTSSQQAASTTGTASKSETSTTKQTTASSQTTSELVNAIQEATTQVDGTKQTDTTSKQHSDNKSRSALFGSVFG